MSQGYGLVELDEPPHTQLDNSRLTPVSDGKLEGAHVDQLQGHKPAKLHARAWKVARAIWLTVFLPVIALAYLIFGYICATRLVPVRIWMVDQPVEHIYKIKAGVTTINIIIIALALLPLQTLLDDIKSEEFFRILHTSTAGTRLKDINNVSIPSYTLTRGVRSIFRGGASRYYTGALLTGVIAVAASSLAPAALSVGLAVADGDTIAIQVGAIRADSVINLGPRVGSKRFEAKTHEAALRGWVQNVLGVEIAFTPASPRYAVPVPLNLEPTTRARYLTDVIILDPVCVWAVPEGPLVSFFEAPSTLPRVWVNLTSLGVGIEMSVSTLAMATNSNTMGYLGIVGSAVVDLDLGLKNLSTSDPVTDGTMAWFLTQCASCQLYNSDTKLDLSGIPTQDFSLNTTNPSSNITTLYAATYSFLVCKPRASVETREVILDGYGKLQVTERSGLVRQGNLHHGQTQLMLSNGLLRYTTESGPETDFPLMGRAAQLQLFFGSNLGNSSETPLLKPESLEYITAQYASAQQAALRSYLSGEIASAYVPGRVQVTKLVFTSSLPHIIVSTILFTAIALFINVCYLRSHTEQFTLFSVAAVLARSNVGAKCEDAKYVDRGAPKSTGLRLVEDRRVYLADSGGQGAYLHME